MGFTHTNATPPPELLRPQTLGAANSLTAQQPSSALIVQPSFNPQLQPPGKFDCQDKGVFRAERHAHLVDAVVRPAQQLSKTTVVIALMNRGWKSQRNFAAGALGETEINDGMLTSHNYMIRIYSKSDSYHVLGCDRMVLITNGANVATAIVALCSEHSRDYEDALDCSCALRRGGGYGGAGEPGLGGQRQHPESLQLKAGAVTF